MPTALCSRYVETVINITRMPKVETYTYTLFGTAILSTLRLFFTQTTKLSWGNSQVFEPASKIKCKTYQVISQPCLRIHSIFSFTNFLLSPSNHPTSAPKKVPNLTKKPTINVQVLLMEEGRLRATLMYASQFPQNSLYFWS